MSKASKGTIPLRRQLAKKLVNYFDELKHKTDQEAADKNQYRSSGSRSPNRKDYPEESLGQSAYKDDAYSRLKLSKIKELMKEEVQKSNIDRALEYEDPGFTKSLMTKSGGDLSRHSSIEPKPVADLLKSKIVEADEIGADEAFPEDDGGPNDGLFHIDLNNIENFKDSKDKDKFDHHQRKSKEIRRIQYWADLDSRRKEGRLSKSPVHSKTEVMSDRDAGAEDDEPRSDPKRKYPVWTVVGGVSQPAYISSVHGFALSPDKKNIEIREGDTVLIEPRKLNAFRPISGKVHKPSRPDGDCDFTAIDGQARRSPIQITERKKKRDVSNTNCTLYDSKGNKLGRAAVDLVPLDPHNKQTDASYSKGVLLDSDSSLSLVLVKMPKPGHVLYKNQAGTETRDRIAEQETSVVGHHQVRCLTLESHRGEPEAFPKQIYLFGKRSQVENHPLFEGENSKAVCEDGKNYEGEIRIQESEHSNFLWIRKEQSLPDGSKAYDYVNVDLDEKCSYPEIEDLLEKMEGLANKRKHQIQRNTERKKEGLDFRIIDKQGRKLRVKITDDNDSDFEPLDSEADEDQEPQAIYYRLEYDGDKLVPLNVMKKTSHQPGSGQKPLPEFASPDRPKNSIFNLGSHEQHKSTDASARTKGDPNAASEATLKAPREQQSPHQPRQKPRSSARGGDSAQSGKSNNNMKIQMDLSDPDTRNIKVVGEGQARFNQRVLPISGLQELGLKPEKLSEQVRRIRNKAVSDIQVFLRFCLNKPKFRAGNSAQLPAIRQQLKNPRVFKKFVAYFLDLPASVPMAAAFESYSEVLGKARSN